MGRANGKDFREKKNLIFHLSALYICVCHCPVPNHSLLPSRDAAGAERGLGMNGNCKPAKIPSKSLYLGSGYLGTCLAMLCEHQHCVPTKPFRAGPPSAPWILLDPSKFLFRGIWELLDVLPREFLGTKVPRRCIYKMSPGGKEIKPRQKLLLLQESQWSIFFFLIKIFQKEKTCLERLLNVPILGQL